VRRLPRSQLNLFGSLPAGGREPNQCNLVSRVNDAGREFRGLEAIKAWSDSDIFAAKVTLAPTDQREADGETVVTTIVDGNFDRTGLPDPVVIDHSLRVAEGKIVRLSCRLADR
jgi:hypothetical protein